MTAAIERPVKKRITKAKNEAPIEVVVVTHFFGAHGGGIELVAERLIREIISDDSLHFSWLSSDCDPTPLVEGLTTIPMRTCNVAEKALGLPWPVWGYKSLRVLSKTVKNADVLWLHDTLYLGNILAFWTARRAKKPIMIAQHIAPIPYSNPLFRWIMHLADKLITSHMLRLADEVIFISDRVAEDYYRRVNFTRPIKVIPNGVDIRVFHPPIAENRRFLRQQFALKAEQPVLLFVGRFVEKKGLDVIRRLATMFPEWRFWLAGSGKIDPDKWLLPNVHVLKNRKGQALAELYQAADLLLIPSYGEGFPLVIQEAMACGLPVLCSPATAQGNIMAMPHLHIADVFPDNSERTAAVWFEKLKVFPSPLPLKKPQDALAEFALTSWDWPPIARIYANSLKKLAKSK
ncbi:MAG: glycosyltransferase [Alphaproteobacteria bacterium]|nr:glycosyltransferase [Alphaproteobacteria bacterium]